MNMDSGKQKPSVEIVDNVLETTKVLVLGLVVSRMTQRNGMGDDASKL
jgi:hypothetical protein